MTLTLVEQGFDAAYVPHGATNMPADHLIRVLSDHREAAEGLFAFVKNARSLSTLYVKELHAAICRSQESSDAVDSLGRTAELARGARIRGTCSPGYGAGPAVNRDGGAGPDGSKHRPGARRLPTSAAGGRSPAVHGPGRSVSVTVAGTQDRRGQAVCDCRRERR
ncbi:MAG: hypothetical protein R3F56_17055 [Planctomycetota bacterium]